MNEAENEFFDTLIEHENAAAQLYRLFSEKFSGDDGKVWTFLCDEEVKHSRMLLQAKLTLEREGKGLKLTDLKTPLLKSAVNFIKKETSKAREKPLEIEKALSLAEKLENSFFESRMHALLDCDSPDFTEIMRQIASETDEHSKVIAKRFDELNAAKEAAVRKAEEAARAKAEAQAKAEAEAKEKAEKEKAAPPKEEKAAGKDAKPAPAKAPAAPAAKPAEKH
jgi:hypothetical protein